MTTARSCILPARELFAHPRWDGKRIVRAFRTDVPGDKATEEPSPNWRQNLAQWKLDGGDFGYHHLGSAIWFNRIGKAMGDAMLELLKPAK